MITRRTKIQLVIFVIITVLGVAYVGARYARLDRIVRDDAYTVVAHFSESGGIFAGGTVTYRGVRVGRVDKLELTEGGVDVYLDIDNKYDDIPSDTLALVGNRSAVGEQYVELQPETDDGPYLENDSEIANSKTSTPIQTETLLKNLSDTVSSIGTKDLRTATTELGTAFAGTGPDLQRIIDTGNDFLQAADDNFGVTTRLIADSNVVLNGQLASESALRTFAKQLSLFTGTVADADPDLRRLFDVGSFAANQLRTFIEQNRAEISSLLNNLITTGEIVSKRLPGIQQVLVLYPYVVEGGFTVVSKTPETGLYDAHFGAIITDQPICHAGYDPSEQREPQDGSNAPMDEDARCTEPAAMSNARGAQNAPPRPGATYGSPTVASYDPDSGKLTWGGDVDPTLSSPGTVAPRSLGEESWKWLYLQPLTAP